MKKINYRNPKVASYLLIGAIFFIIGFSYGWAFFIIGALLIFAGISENKKLS